MILRYHTIATQPNPDLIGYDPSSPLFLLHCFLQPPFCRSINVIVKEIQRFNVPGTLSMPPNYKLKAELGFDVLPYLNGLKDDLNSLLRSVEVLGPCFPGLRECLRPYIST